MKLSIALEYLINLSSFLEIKSQINLVVLNFLENYLENNDNASKTLTKMLIIKVMIHQIFENSDITQKLFNIFKMVLFNLKTLINLLILNLSAIDQNDLQNENLEVLILITDVISILFQKSLNDQENNHHLRIFIENKDCLELFLLILLMEIRNDGINILAVHQNEDVIKAINNIKYNIMHSANIMHHYFLRIEDLRNNEIFNMNYYLFNESLLKNIVGQFKLIFCTEKFLETNKKLIEVIFKIIL